MARKSKQHRPEPEPVYVSVVLDTGKAADVHPDTLAQIKRVSNQGDVWFAYQNIDMSSPLLGHLVFLVCGPGRTYQDRAAMPQRAPDGPHGLGWRYDRIGCFDPASL